MTQAFLGYPRHDGKVGVRNLNSCPRAPLRISRFRSVSKTPGAMALTVTPWRAHSTASARVKPATAALLAVYAATSCSPTNDASEATPISRPEPRAIIDGANV